MTCGSACIQSFPKITIQLKKKHNTGVIQNRNVAIQLHSKVITNAKADIGPVNKTGYLKVYLFLLVSPNNELLTKETYDKPLTANKHK